MGLRGVPRLEVERWGVRSAFVFALLALAVAAGCGNGGRGSYVKANERLFAGLPEYPGAELKREISAAYSEHGGTRVLGYVTRFEFSLPANASETGGGWSFFERRLRPKWLWVDTLAGPVLEFRRGDAFVSINLESERGHVLEVAVDHDYYGKLGRCGIPGGCGGSPAWIEIRRAILGCRVKAVSQTHARAVTVELKSGRMLTAKELAIDAVLDVLNAARCRLQPTVATE
jgi:hypothetical protein